MDQIADRFIQFEQQIRILHWQTKSYARHKAYGDYFDGLSESIDEFIETYMGKYGRVKTSGTIELKNMDEISIADFLDEIKEFLINLSSELDKTEDTDLLNIRDEMLGHTKKLRYFLTLK